MKKPTIWRHFVLHCEKLCNRILIPFALSFHFPRRIISSFIRSLDIEIYAYNPKTDLMRRITTPTQVWYVSRDFVTDADNWVKKLEPLMENPGVIVDVGANEGYTSAWFAQRSDIVYAFEPHPTNFQRMKTLNEIRNIKNVVTYQCAISNREGIVDLYVKTTPGHHSLADIGASKSVAKIQVNATTLDSFSKDKNIEKISILKIDVEGFEFEVLEGATKLIQQKAIDMIFFEFSPKFYIQRGEDPFQIPRFLKEQGYVTINLDNVAIDLFATGQKQCDVIAFPA